MARASHRAPSRLPLLALLLALAPCAVAGETLHVAFTINPEAATVAPGVDGLRAGLQRLFTGEYSRFVDLSFDGSAARGPADASVQVTLGAAIGAVTVDTDLTRGSVTRSLASTVPVGSPASLVATIAGDIAFLHFSSGDFSALHLSPGPGLTATLQTDTLQALTGWNAEDLEPLALAQAGDELTVCFPHAYLTLGPLFRITASTLRDLHGQASGREQLQLSGICVGAADRLYLLSERQGKIALVNPRLGTRQVFDAPGLSALGARLLDDDTLAVLSSDPAAAGLSVYSFSGAPWRSVPIAASYVSAFSRDREGNLWAWDAGERRVRILTPDGREIYSIKPLFKASTMQLPQQMEALDDGSFLLAGYGEVWKFENTGIPVWRLSRIPGRPGEQLPPSFALAVNRSDGSFTILDAPSRRLLAFSPAPTGDSAQLASLLSRLDGRKQADLDEASGLAQGIGLPLMAWQFGDLLARAGGPEKDRADARIALLKEKAALYVDLADSLARDLLYSRADEAYLRAGESARELANEAPGDPDAAQLLESVVSRRQEVRSALAQASDIRVVAASARAEQISPFEDSLVVLLRLRNAAPDKLAQIRVHVSLPAIVLTPSLAVIDSLAPGEERDVEIRIGLTGSVSAPADAGLSAAALVTYERGVEGISASFSFPVQMTDPAQVKGPAESLARRALPGDALLGALADTLLDPADSPGKDPFTTLAGILDSLGSVRSQAPVAAGTSSAAQQTSADATLGLRAVLRGLSPDEADWTTATVSIAGSLGLRPGLVSWKDRVFTLVDAGIAVADAIAAMPGLARFNPVLTALARDGNLWLPVSGQVPPLGASATAWAIADALEALAEGTGQDFAVSWPLPGLTAPSGTAPVPVPFPFVLPTAPAPLSRDALLRRISAALEQHQGQ